MPLARCTTSRFASWLAGLNEFDPSNGSVLSKKALVHRKEYHGRVFTLSEIKAVVAKFGIPDNRWKVDPAMKYDKFIEVQVWDDTPIKEFLAAG